MPSRLDRTPETPTKQAQDTVEKDGEESSQTRRESAETKGTATTTTASSRRTSHKRASSQTLASQLSGSSSSSAPKVVSHSVSITDLRAQAQIPTQDDDGGCGGPIIIKDGDKLAENASAMMSLSSNGIGFSIMEPDFGSDDSDGPPSEVEEEEEEKEKKPE